MAGYKPKRTLYRLTFEDPDFEGLEVVTKKISFDGLIKFIGLFEEAQVVVEKEAPDQESLKVMAGLFERFLKVLVSWNIEDDDDQPVPRTLDGLQSLEPDFIMAVIESWIAGMVKAPPPLPGGSPPGETPPEESLQLASQSMSLPSTPVPG